MMFNKKKKEMQETAIESNGSSNIIGKGTTLEGNLNTNGNIRIEGKLIGSIITKAKLVLGNTAWVKGNINAQVAEIAGEVHGTLEVDGVLILKSSAIIQGDLNTNKIIVEEGAQFNGKCKMPQKGQVIDHKETMTKINLVGKQDTTMGSPITNHAHKEQQATS